MTKKELAIEVGNNLDFKSDLVLRVINETIRQIIRNDETLMTGFGRFWWGVRKRKIGRHPMTGEQIIIPAHERLLFKSTVKG